GGMIGIACRGSEGNVCGSGAHTLSGVYLISMVDDRVEIGVQEARAGGKSREYSIYRDASAFNRQTFDLVPHAPARIDLALVDQSRTFLLSRVAYHFLRGERVRPLLGAEVGQLIDRHTLVCKPSGCETLLSLLVRDRIGQQSSHHLDLGFIAGGSVRA